MAYRKYVTVTVPAQSEYVASCVTSTQPEPKHVYAVVPGTGSDNIDLLVYVEREKIVDYPVDLLNTQERVVSLDISLPVGQSMYVGFRNKTTSPITVDVGVIYDIRR